MFIAINDFWVNIAQGLEQILENIGGWNWGEISTQVKNWLLSGSGIAVVGLFLKFGVPYFKSNKQLALISKLIERVVSLETEQQTVGNVLTEYISLQSEVNTTSRTLTADQKQKFTNLATALKTMQNERYKNIGAEIEEMVEDNVITAEESVELLKNVPVIEQALGTNINNIGK